MEREETTRISRETGHEVDDQVVDEDTESRERYIGERISDRDSCRAEESIVRLLPEDRTTEHLDGHLHEGVMLVVRPYEVTVANLLHRRYPEYT